MKKTNLLFLVGMFTLLFFTACEKEAIETITPDTLKEQVSADLGVENNVTIVFNDDVAGLSETELTEKYLSASTGEKLQFQRNFLILEMYREKGIITEANAADWASKPIEEALRFDSYLSAEAVQELKDRFETIMESTLRANCSFSCITIPHPYWPTGAPITICGIYTCSSNTVVLYEGNNATQDLVGVIDANVNKLVKFKWNNCCPNDEARSMRMWNMDDNQVITVYDDPYGRSWKDDWARVRMKQDASMVTISTFEKNTNNSIYQQTYITGGNLDGKVSALRVSGN